MVFELTRIVYGLLFSTIIGALAYWRRSLTLSGWLGAIITGTATFGFGGWSWGLLLITFFVTSSLLSHYKESVKAARTGEQFAKGGRRDLWQALANGGPASLLALLYALSDQSAAVYVAAIGVLATATADTWATELGILSDQSPRLVTTWQPISTGTSGAVTLLGLLAAAAGGLTIGCAALLFALLERASGFATPVILWIPLIGLASGFVGALCDSFLGATVQAIYADSTGAATERSVGPEGTPYRHIRGWFWLNNDAVNLLSTLFGGVIALLLFSLLPR